MSYDPTHPSDLDRLRHEIGDISNDAATELRSDDHIEAALAEYGYNAAVAFVADGLAAEYAQEPDRIGLPSGLSASWSKRIEEWRRTATRFRALAAQAEAATAAASRVSVAVPIRVTW